MWTRRCGPSPRLSLTQYCAQCDAPLSPAESLVTTRLEQPHHSVDFQWTPVECRELEIH